MSIICAISNEVPEVPVISPASGSIFEKRLIEKYIEENGEKDPVSGTELTTQMLIEVKVPAFVKAKPPSYTSIPAILKSLQDEWDSVMLHSFTMRQQLQTARQELSHAMYQHDAACRVIARLTREVAAAREALATLKPKGHQDSDSIHSMDQSAPTAEQESNEIKVAGLSSEVLAQLNETAVALTAERKKKGKVVPENLASAEQLSSYSSLSSLSGLHSASTPGITCMDLQGDTIVTGGKDKTIAIFDVNSQEIRGVLKGHSKRVMHVVAHPKQPIAMSGSVDTTVRIWNTKTQNGIHVLRIHDEAITGLSLHATGDYLLASSMDRFWSLSDIRTGVVLAKVLGDADSALTSAKFHPDGLICATGTLSADVRIWDVKEQGNVANFAGHNTPVTSVAFSENGYYLATAGEVSSIKLWDLRKLKNFKTLELGANYTISDLDFDSSGTYLAVAGSDIKVFNTKTWNEIVKFEDHTDVATGVRFGTNAQFLASTSLDRTLKIYGGKD